LVAIALSFPSLAQGTAAQPAADKSNPWAYSLTVDGYIVPNGTGYASPIFTADNNWHFEARYNDENLYTGSLWFGYNFNFGKKNLKLTLTPMLGGVMGRTTGVAPGLETTLTYKKIEFYAASEYVFNTTKASGSFFYSWPQLTYSIKWFRIGAVAQHTKAYHQPQHAARISGWSVDQEAGIYDVRFRSGAGEPDYGAGGGSELLIAETLTDLGCVRARLQSCRKTC